MTDPATAPPPLAIDRVERARGKGDDVRLRISGRWMSEAPVDVRDALLVVQLQGHRHRFAADRDAETSLLPGTWQAEFSIPTWAVPTQPGIAAVWIGSAVIAVQPPGSIEPAPPPQPAPVTAQAPIAPERAPDGAVDAGRGADPGIEAGIEPAPPRAGPLANLLLKETVAALHAELERRSGEAAQLRGALADAHAELEARAAGQAALEAAHGELRHELEELMAVVPRQREQFDGALAGAREHAAELERQLGDQVAALERRLGERAGVEQRLAQEGASLREQLAAAQISRDAAISEAGGLRSELERMGAELAVVREQATAHGGDLGEAQRLLADARALTEQLRGEGA